MAFQPSSNDKPLGIIIISESIHLSSPNKKRHLISLMPFFPLIFPLSANMSALASGFDRDFWPPVSLPAETGLESD